MTKRKLNCEHCGKGIVVHHYLQDHNNTNTGEKAHVCKVCGKHCELCYGNFKQCETPTSNNVPNVKKY